MFKILFVLAAFAAAQVYAAPGVIAVAPVVHHAHPVVAHPVVAHPVVHSPIIHHGAHSVHSHVVHHPAPVKVITPIVAKPLVAVHHVKPVVPLIPVHHAHPAVVLHH